MAALGIVVPDLRRDRVKLVTAMQVTARSIGRAMDAVQLRTVGIVGGGPPA